jgi:hypothetical protein
MSDIVVDLSPTPQANQWTGAISGIPVGNARAFNAAVYCPTTCAPACVSRTCGDDGCGGQCGTCLYGYQCNSAGQCVEHTLVTPHEALDLQLIPPTALAMGTDGSTYAAGNMGNSVPINFGSPTSPINLTSTGGYDVFLAKYDVNGNAVWAKNIGDDGGPGTLTDQTATGVAITANGTLGLIGKTMGTVTFGPNVLVSSSVQVGGSTVSIPSAYLAAVSAADGSRLWARGFDLGAGGLLRAVAASPMNSAGRFAICGDTPRAATSLVPGTTYGGGSDIIIGVFDSAGNKLWAQEIGGSGNEDCSAVAVDDNDDVYAAGYFDGPSLAFCPTGSSSNGVACTGTPITLTGPGTPARKFMWVAKFAGGTGNTLAATSYSGSAGAVSPNSLAVDAAGDIAVGGSYTGNPIIGATLTNQGGNDAFIAKLSGTTLAPAWNALTWGGTGDDLVRQLGFTSYGDIVAVGAAAPSMAAFHTANGGHDTIGAFTLNVNGTTSTDAFVVKVNGATGVPDNGTTYGGPTTNTGDSLAINRFGTTTNQIAFTMFWSGDAPIPPIVGSLPAAGGGDSALVFSRLY